MKCNILLVSLLVTIAVHAQPMVLITPDGGETIQSGELVTVRWSPRISHHNISAHYSIDQGMTWIPNVTYRFNDSSCMWLPYVKELAENVILRVILFNADGDTISRDISDSGFTILPIIDDYEPNNDFSSAYPISAVDSLVKNACIHLTDSSVNGNFLYDVDLYKVRLDAGKLLKITLFEYVLAGTISLEYNLYDSSRTLLFSSSQSISFPYGEYGVIKQSGIYYIEVAPRYDRYFNGAFLRTTTKYDMSIQQVDTAGIIKVLSPNGGEIFNAEQYVKVYWDADTSVHQIGLQYSIDSGETWLEAWYEHTDSLPSKCHLWKVPHLKNTTGRAYIRIRYNDIINSPVDVSDLPFTILASKNDAYEPDNEFASARAIEPGDSVVKNAIVICGYVEKDTISFDTSLADNDFYKISLAAGKVVSIYCTEDDVGGFYEGRTPEDRTMISLFDASKNLIKKNYRSLNTLISQTGVYYIEIASANSRDRWVRYSMSIYQSDPITLISPNGGENFQPGQWVTVNTKTNPLFGSLRFYYSLDNGASWVNTNNTPIRSQPWRWVVPSLKTLNTQVLFKVEGGTEPDLQVDFSNESFTIQPVQPDVYEPNNTVTTAYPIAEGDSVIRNASIWTILDTAEGFNNPVPDTYDDNDFYKINLINRSIVAIRIYAPDSIGMNGLPDIDFIDFSNNSLSPVSRAAPGTFNTSQAGMSFIKISPTPYSMRGYYSKYGLSVHSIRKLATQVSTVDSITAQYDVTNSGFNYKNHLIADITNMTIDFYTETVVNDSVFSMILASEDFKHLPGETALKTFAIQTSVDKGLQSKIVISVPYEQSELNGYSEKLITAIYKDNPAENIWYALPQYSVDTVKNHVNFRLPPLNFRIIQINIKTDSTAVSNNHSKPFIPGINANLISQNQCVITELSLQKETTAEIRLYNLQGRCVKKNYFTAAAGSSTYLWNLSGLSGGRYIIMMRAGMYQLKKSILLLK